jgi:hypothetical protein
LDCRIFINGIIITKMEDVKHVEFLAINSKEIIEKQVDSYRHF